MECVLRRFLFFTEAEEAPAVKETASLASVHSALLVHSMNEKAMNQKWMIVLLQLLDLQISSENASASS